RGRWIERVRTRHECLAFGHPKPHAGFRLPVHRIRRPDDGKGRNQDHAAFWERVKRRRSAEKSGSAQRRRKKRDRRKEGGNTQPDGKRPDQPVMTASS